MNEENAFLQSLRDNPEDNSLRLVYSDWLEERGEVQRAEYVRFECQLTQARGRLAALRPHLDPAWLAAVRRNLVRAVLRVVRGLRIGVEFSIYEGQNFVGRPDVRPVDVDLEDQEPPDRVWTSRQHALILCDENGMFLEDLNTANGTYLNRTRVYPGEPRPLQTNDVIQIGTVQMKVMPE